MSDESSESTDSRITAADLLGSAVIGDGKLVTNVIMVVTAVDMETGEEQVFIVEDDNLPVWKAYGLLAFAKDTYFGETDGEG